MNAVILGPEIFIPLLVVTGLGIWAAIDAGSRPTWAFERANQNKTVWIVLPIVGIFLCGLLTLVAAIIWFASIRPKVVAAEAGGSPYP